MVLKWYTVMTATLHYIIPLLFQQHLKISAFFLRVLNVTVEYAIFYDMDEIFHSVMPVINTKIGI